MVKRITYILTLLMLFGFSFGINAQKDNKQMSPEKIEKARLANIKNELATAKANIKSGNNLDKSVASLSKLLADSLSKNDLRIHSMLLDVVRKQYAQGNEKLFLKQKYDTASIYTLCHKLFLTAKNLDDVDALPNAKGQVNPKYRKEDSEELSHYIQNLYGGTVYFVNKQKWADAQSLADTYLSMQQWPLFSERSLGIDTLHEQHTAYLYLLSAYKQNKFQDVLKYDSLALRFSKRHELTMELVAKSVLALKDTAKYISCLENGVDAYPTNTYFFPRLVDLYCAEGQYDKALAAIDKNLAIDSLSLIAMTARQSILFNLERYDECISLGDKIISLSDSIPEVYYNVAMSYWHQVLVTEKAALKLKDKNKKLNAIYKQCRPYMERYRALRPDDKEHWKPVLYTIYLNLNLGKEFAEIENE